MHGIVVRCMDTQFPCKHVLLHQPGCLSESSPWVLAARSAISHNAHSSSACLLPRLLDCSFSCCMRLTGCEGWLFSCTAQTHAVMAFQLKSLKSHIPSEAQALQPSKQNVQKALVEATETNMHGEPMVCACVRDKKHKGAADKPDLNGHTPGE